MATITISSKTEAYETVSELISNELSNAIGNILKGIEDIANGKSTELSEKLSLPEANDVAKDFIDSLSSIDVDLKFSTSESRNKKEKTVTPFILLPSGRSEDEAKIKILAPSRSIKVRSEY